MGSFLQFNLGSKLGSKLWSKIGSNIGSKMVLMLTKDKKTPINGGVLRF